jgi:hypothetical protein
VEGYAKPSAELEINVGVKYVGEDDRTDDLTIPFCLFNSLILQYLPHATHFPKSLPLSHFPQTMPNFPFIRPFDRNF